jgi:hypothetical protein
MSGLKKLLYMCCSGRKVRLTLLLPLKSHLRLRHFLEDIRKHNFCFLMMSFGTTKEVHEPGYMPSWSKAVYYHVGATS